MEDQACTYRDNSIDHRSQHREWSYATQAISNQERWSRNPNHRMHNQKHHLPSHCLRHWIRLQCNVKIGIWWIFWFTFIPNIYLVVDSGSINKVPRRSGQGCHGKNSRTIYTYRFSSSWHVGRWWVPNPLGKTVPLYSQSQHLHRIRAYPLQPTYRKGMLSI